MACSDTKSLQLPYYNEADFTPIFVKNKKDVANKIPHQIANFAFLNQDSTLITEKNIEGKIHVANFIFTSCGSICPTMTRNMKIVSDSLKNEKSLSFLSYSVTPWIDKPNVLKKFKEKNQIQNKNWHFLTGSKSSIYQLARQSYFAEEDLGFSKDSTEFLHTEHFILVDKNKRIRGIYNGTLTLEMQQLIQDIRTLSENEKF
jgi:protein SCO1/2